MYNKSEKLAAIIAVVFKIIILATLVFSAIHGSKKNVFLSFLAASCIVLPFLLSYIAKRKSVILPESFTLVFLIFLLSAQYLGELLSFYYRFWWWDLMLHGIFGFYTVLIGTDIIRGIIVKGPEITERRFHFLITVFGFSFSMTLGILWELFEFVGDYLFKSNMMKEGLMDTMTDLLSSAGTAFGWAAIYYLMKRRIKK